MGKRIENLNLPHRRRKERVDSTRDGIIFFSEGERKLEERKRGVGECGEGRKGGWKGGGRVWGGGARGRWRARKGWVGEGNEGEGDG